MRVLSINCQTIIWSGVQPWAHAVGEILLALQVAFDLPILPVV